MGRSKSLRLACWNADGVWGRELELQQFLNQHGIGNNPLGGFCHSSHVGRQTGKVLPFIFLLSAH
jgi:hypothetical protein